MKKLFWVAVFSVAFVAGWPGVGVATPTRGPFYDAPPAPSGTFGGTVSGPIVTPAVTIPADATSPTISGGSYFVTSANTGSTTITGFTGGATDQEFLVCGGSNTNSSTISDGGNFTLANATITLSSGVCVRFKAVTATTYKQLGAIADTATNALKAAYFVDESAAPADTGALRFGNDASACWRSAPSSTNHCLRLTASEYFYIDLATGFLLADNIGFAVGTGVDAQFRYSTVQTPDSALLTTSADSNALIIAENADLGIDFAHPQQTNPTLFIQSSDATNPAQWVSLSHNQTNGVLDVGTGALSIPDSIDLLGTVTNTGASNNGRVYISDTFETTGVTLLSTSSGQTVFTAATYASMRNSAATDQNTFEVGSAGGYHLVIGSQNNSGKDYDVAEQVYPQLVVASGTDPDSDNTEHVIIYHDATNGHIKTDKGVLAIDSMIAPKDTLFAALGTPANGIFTYCSDCNKATPCTGGGCGAIAKRLASAWDCD